MLSMPTPRVTLADNNNNNNNNGSQCMNRMIDLCD